MFKKNMENQMLLKSLPLVPFKLGAIRDVGRVMQLPLFQIDELCKMIPFNPAQRS